MVITYQGEGCFKIQSGELSIVIDPTSDRLKPDILIKTSSAVPPEKPRLNEISGAGEYEIRGAAIRGFQAIKESTARLIKTIYSVSAEEITLGILGSISSAPDPELIEKLGDVDILFLPVGGKPYLDAAKAAKIVKQLEPAFVVPSFYKNPTDFFEEMGQKSAAQEKLVVKKKDILEAKRGAKVICLRG